MFKWIFFYFCIMVKKWRCRICGYVAAGEKPPNLCPVCGAPENDFVEVNDTEEQFIPHTKSRPYSPCTKSGQWSNGYDATFARLRLRVQFPAGP